MPEDTIDVYQLLESLSDKTTDNELKKIIVQEVFEHKDDYVKYIDILLKFYDSCFINSITHFMAFPVSKDLSSFW